MTYEDIAKSNKKIIDAEIKRKLNIYKYSSYCVVAVISLILISKVFN